MQRGLQVIWLICLGQSSAYLRKDYGGLVGFGTVRFVHDSLQQHTVRVGQDISFTCQVKNIGNYKVAWIHAEKGIIAVHPDVLGQNDRIKSTHDNSDSWSLIIKSVQESDAGKYICQVNTEVPDSISGTLSVEVPPDIIDELSSKDTLVTEGMRVTLSCESRGVPKPTITWRREPKSEGERHAELIRVCRRELNLRTDRWEDSCNEVEQYVGDVLELLNVNRFDSGIYLCIANNKVPPSVSKKVQLYVDYPPTLSVFHQLVGKVIGQNATLECLSAGHPPPFNLWKKDGEYISNIIHRVTKYIVQEGSERGRDRNKFTKLTITNIQPKDFGTYQCEAKNSLGNTTGNIRLYEIHISTSTVLTSTSTNTYRRNPDFGEVTSVGFLDRDRYDTESEQSSNKRTSKNNEQKSIRERGDSYLSSSGFSTANTTCLPVAAALFLLLLTLIEQTHVCQRI